MLNIYYFICMTVKVTKSWTFIEYQWNSPNMESVLLEIDWKQFCQFIPSPCFKLLLYKSRCMKFDIMLHTCSYYSLQLPHANVIIRVDVGSSNPIPYKFMFLHFIQPRNELGSLFLLILRTWSTVFKGRTIIQLWFSSRLISLIMYRSIWSLNILHFCASFVEFHPKCCLILYILHLSHVICNMYSEAGCYIFISFYWSPFAHSGK